MKRVLMSTAAALALTIAGQAAAQAFPEKPVTVLVPAAAGGPSDTVARIG
jgi:tripartite-type tricarboxylate transporter receptor subunit TctC